MATGSMFTLAQVTALTALAALSRHALPQTQSRVHILVFLLLAGLTEWGVRSASGLKPRLRVAILTGACTTGSILLVRWLREGLCPHTWPQCPDPLSAYSKMLGF